MTEERVFDYSRQRVVNRAFPVFVAISIGLGVWFRIGTPSDMGPLMLTYFGIPTPLLLLSGLMGAASKRAIDYIPGEWKHQTTWASFPEYDRMVKEHEKAYGHLYAHAAEGLTCCILLPIALGLGAVSVFYQQFEPPLFGNLIDSSILITIQYGIVSVLGFLVGYRMVKIDPKTFFKPPLSGDTYAFSRELARVQGIKAGVSVKVGERGDLHMILDAECKVYIDGLPDTVMMKVQVSKSGFVYPYLVGTIYKGKTVDKATKRVMLGTRYPGLFEFSMDKDVTVVVGRFDIPQRSSDVPSVSKADFRALAAELVRILQETYKP
jgi:hypothetical protein